MKKLKWYGVLFAFVILFIYLMGIYDLFMMLGHNEAYYASHGYGQGVVDYFTDYPIKFLIFWITNLLCGFVSPILYIARKKIASKIAFISFIADGILITLTSIFRNRISVLGISVFIFDLIILIITLGFYLFCKMQEKNE